MINQRLLTPAIRTRAESLVVATTGSATLSATSTGYARATGSFVDDGFVVGMEVTPVGFTQTAPGVITASDALSITISGGRSVQSAGAARALVSGIPSIRFYGNRGGSPTVLRPYITEQLVQGASEIQSWPEAGGRLQEDFSSFWTLYGIAGTGDDAILAWVSAFLALFAPGTVLALGDGTSVRVRGKVAPKAGQILPVDGGWARCMVTLPLRAWTHNVIAA